FINGEDTLDLPVEIKPGDRIEGAKIVLSDTHTELSGSVTDSRYAARPLTVVVFASDRRFWTPSSRRVLATPVSTDGHYSFTDIPPGEYRVAATLALDQDTLLGDAGILTELEHSAATITLADGERKTLSLSTIQMSVAR